MEGNRIDKLWTQYYDMNVNTSRGSILQRHLSGILLNKGMG